MSTFDTHGGHFSPVGYLKVTTGGSHEENPNGGVQIGVDQNGIPNMLEEGEPVYKDFVYSDNINAESSMLEKYHIPVKYAGKLYSEIADIFVDEASERTNDGVTNNGLNAMLLRLANAQEEQKQIAEQKALEEELSQMSPEELAQLEEALEAQIAEEQVAEQQPVEAVPAEAPMMANGGLMRKFDDGTPGEIVITPEERAAQALLSGVNRADSLYNDILARNAAAEEAAKIQSHKDYLTRRVERLRKVVARDEAKAKQMEENTSKLHKSTLPSHFELLKKQYGLIDYNKERLRRKEDEYETYFGYKYGEAPAVEDPEIISAVPAKTVEVTVPAGKSGVVFVEPSEIDWANGGLMNKYPDGGEKEDLMFGRNAVRPSYLPGNTVWAGSPWSPGNYGEFNYINNLVNSDSNLRDNLYKIRDAISGESKAPGFTLAKPKKLIGQDALPASFDETPVDWKNAFSGLSFNTDDIYNIPDEPIVLDEKLNLDTTAKIPAKKIVKDTVVDDSYSPLPTITRYAGAFNNAAMAAYNLAQQPDKYSLPVVNPVLPYGRMSLQRLSYNPVDMGMLANSIQAQGAGTMRNIRNAGLGPSTGAAMLAAGYNNTRNLGTGLLQGWQANNQQRNAVLAANNNAAAQEAQFNFNADAARADAINRNNMLRQRYNLMIQQLNNEAEQAKFNAVGHETDSLADALAGMGRENFIMNQINTNKALSYSVVPDGTGHYKIVPVRSSKCGGLMKTYKK